jgi:hypothetical protein
MMIEPRGHGGVDVSTRPSGALEIRPGGTRFIVFDDCRMTGIALGFIVGAAVVALRGRH